MMTKYPNMSSTQVTTISFYTYPRRIHQWQAFARMGQFPLKASDFSGLQFFKLLGSGGGNGFSVWPDWGTYAFLAVWRNEADAERAFAQPQGLLSTLKNGAERWQTVFMRTMHAHGRWDGQSPFEVGLEYDKQLPLAVITRGRIKLSKLWSFWRFVPKVSRSADDKPGMLFSKGIGELPLIQQATFSVWESSQAMMDYAYNSPLHREVVEKTRRLGWYKEDLFARFYPYRTMGNWTAFEGVERLLGGR